MERLRTGFAVVHAAQAAIEPELLRQAGVIAHNRPSQHAVLDETSNDAHDVGVMTLNVGRDRNINSGQPTSPSDLDHIAIRQLLADAHLRHRDIDVLRLDPREGGLRIARFEIVAVFSTSG